MDKSLVSVIMPVYNAEKYLHDAVASVLAQTYPHWELWLIDDASADHSREIINTLSRGDQRIRSIHLEHNSGSAVARNKGIEAANGKYIAFLDADDRWLPEKLSRQVEFMQQNNYVFTCTDYAVMDAQGALSNKIIKAPSKANYRQLLKNNSIGCLTAIYDAEQLGKCYMPDIRKRQDYGTWLNILRTGAVVHGLNETLAVYRYGMDSLSNKKTGVLKYNWQLLRRHQQLSFLAAAYYFTCFLYHKSIKYLRG